MQYKQYQRLHSIEMRPYLEGEKLNAFVSVSEADRRIGCPKVGDMIARNPKKQNDMWLVEEQYFKDNFKAL